jgi:hypothetical protein
MGEGDPGRLVTRESYDEARRCTLTPPDPLAERRLGSTLATTK